MCCLELGIIRSLAFSSLRPVLLLSWIFHNFLICAGDVLCIPDWTVHFKPLLVADVLFRSLRS